ncbi:polyketide cyclase/dehydrase/lipid transport protein [Streptomyces sp. Amel2xB2]|uniref:SRPBCC family protein n=1 Tax=Streptomyces sp. Amel2xB2 TaxID=1305829 RepID=UPI000DBA19C2|nr:SRPBCC family protein [Streptomyces sp. Amel2xB2]RAJ61815.1 polyketide cyclase/dehydrase/lipid transport protein [Streptomyces sp. Amel2xB2]
MTTWQVTVERRISAPAARVWEALTDIEGSPRVISGIERVEMLSDGPFGKGTRWRETRSIFGKEATEEMWVTASEPQRRYVVESDSRGVHYTSEFALTPEGDDVTVVRLSFASETDKKSLTGTMGKFLGSIGSKAVAKSLAKDLEDVSVAAEAPA